MTFTVMIAQNVQVYIIAGISCATLSIIDKRSMEDDKMKKFKAPIISVLKLDSDSVMTTSACFETFACTECYCSIVQCGNDSYSCTGLVCGTLSDYE